MSTAVLSQLVLMRHALAEGGGNDMDRCLTPQGEADAAERGRQLAQWNGDFDQALVSPARRTRQTAELAVPPGTQIDLVEEIYDGSAGQLAAALERATSDRVMMVGHNPGISMLVSYLTRQSIHMAPGSVVLIEFDPPASFPLQSGSGTIAMTLQG